MTAAVRPAPEPHEHVWRVTSFEPSSRTIRYKCRDCGRAAVRAARGREVISRNPPRERGRAVLSILASSNGPVPRASLMAAIYSERDREGSSRHFRGVEYRKACANLATCLCKLEARQLITRTDGGRLVRLTEAGRRFAFAVHEREAV